MIGILKKMCSLRLFNTQKFKEILKILLFMNYDKKIGQNTCNKKYLGI